jgi:hypothetical protein
MAMGMSTTHHNCTLDPAMQSGKGVVVYCGLLLIPASGSVPVFLVIANTESQFIACDRELP